MLSHRQRWRRPLPRPIQRRRIWISWKQGAMAFLAMFMLSTVVSYWILSNNHTMNTISSRPCIEFEASKKEPNKTHYHYLISRYDGFGSQYIARMHCMALCDLPKNNCTYIHSPITQMQHAGNMTTLNEFMGIPFAEPPALNITVIKHADCPGACGTCMSRPDELFTSDALRKIRGYYWSTPKPFINNRTEIVIHIRRGDPKGDSGYERNHERPSEEYAKLISLLKKEYPAYKITIFSMGNESDFEGLKQQNVDLVLNSELVLTFHTMATAQVLVVDLSMFSWAAGYLNPNTVIQLPVHYAGLRRWKEVNKEYTSVD